MSELYRIRPLVWHYATAEFHCAKAIGQKYGIEFVRGKWMLFLGATAISKCDSPEHGKQLAEAHWRERLESVLERADG